MVAKHFPFYLCITYYIHLISCYYMIFIIIIIIIIIIITMVMSWFQDYFWPYPTSQRPSESQAWRSELLTCLPTGAGLWAKLKQTYHLLWHLEHIFVSKEYCWEIIKDCKFHDSINKGQQRKLNGKGCSVEITDKAKGTGSFKFTDKRRQGKNFFLLIDIDLFTDTVAILN